MPPKVLVRPSGPERYCILTTGAMIEHEQTGVFVIRPNGKIPLEVTLEWSAEWEIKGEEIHINGGFSARRNISGYFTLQVWNPVTDTHTTWAYFLDDADVPAAQFSAARTAMHRSSKVEMTFADALHAAA